MYYIIIYNHSVAIIYIYIYIYIFANMIFLKDIIKTRVVNRRKILIYIYKYFY